MGFGPSLGFMLDADSDCREASSVVSFDFVNFFLISLCFEWVLEIMEANDRNEQRHQAGNAWWHQAHRAMDGNWNRNRRTGMHASLVSILLSAVLDGQGRQ
jgi:hypothetical protein